MNEERKNSDKLLIIERDVKYLLDYVKDKFETLTKTIESGYATKLDLQELESKHSDLEVRLKPMITMFWYVVTFVVVAILGALLTLILKK